MRAAVSRAIVVLATCCFGESRREWSAAIRAEFDVALDDGQPLRFAIGCLAVAGRMLLAQEEGRFTLTSYTIVLGLMIPMAALQIGCALFGLPYLYPGQHGLAGALLEGRDQEHLLRGTYQSAVPALALLQLLAGIGHVCLAWLMLEGSWAAVMRLAILTLATAATLVIFMGILFIDGSQAVLQGAVLASELAVIAAIARWHARLPAPAGKPQSH